MRTLNYLCSLAVNPAKGVISHIQADLADSRDSLHLPGLIEHLQARLLINEMPLREVVADSNYSCMAQQVYSQLYVSEPSS